MDDDASVRRALARLLKAQSFDAETFGSAAEFILSLDARVPDCLVVDPWNCWGQAEVFAPASEVAARLK